MESSIIITMIFVGMLTYIIILKKENKEIYEFSEVLLKKYENSINKSEEILNKYEEILNFKSNEDD